MISVIVPVYNMERWLQRCVDSVLAQTFRDFELILVDDGSRDGSLAECFRIARRDSRIRVVHQENAGPNAARNHGIDEARGEFVAFVDADDEFYTPDTLESNVKFLITDPEIDVVSFPQYRESDDTKEICNKPAQLTPGLLSDKLTIFTNWYNGRLIDGHFPGKIFRKSLFDGWRLTEEIRFTEDHHDIPMMCRRLRKVQISGVGGYLYKSNEESAIHTAYTPFKRYGQLKSQTRIFHYLKELGGCRSEESDFYLRALENAYYLLGTEYEEKSLATVKGLPRRWCLGATSGFRTLLMLAVFALGAEAGLNSVRNTVGRLAGTKH